MKCIKILTFLLFIVTYFAHSFCSANNLEDKSTKELNQIITICIELNEDFKKSVGKIDSGELKKRRKRLEGYYESHFLPKSDDYVESIGFKKNSEVAFNLLKMILSYRNSADEQLPYIFGKIFLYDPDFISDFFKNFSIEDQKYLYSQLEFGWKQVNRIENLNNHIVMNRSEKLKQIWEIIVSRGGE